MIHYPLGFGVIAERVLNRHYLYPLDQNRRSKVRIPLYSVRKTYGWHNNGVAGKFSHEVASYRYQTYGVGEYMHNKDIQPTG